MRYTSPIMSAIGITDNSAIIINPLSCVDNRQLSINNQPFDIWDVLATHIDQNIKISEKLREILISLINPNVSRTNRLELPFLSQTNSINIEVFCGNSRYLLFRDVQLKDCLRFKEIPYDSSDPEIYIGDE